MQRPPGKARLDRIGTVRKDPHVRGAMHTAQVRYEDRLILVPPSLEDARLAEGR